MVHKDRDKNCSKWPFLVPCRQQELTWIIFHKMLWLFEAVWHILISPRRCIQCNGYHFLAGRILPHHKFHHLSPSGMYESDMICQCTRDFYELDALTTFLHQWWIRVFFLLDWLPYQGYYWLISEVCSLLEMQLATQIQILNCGCLHFTQS